MEIMESTKQILKLLNAHMNIAYDSVPYDFQ